MWDPIKQLIRKVRKLSEEAKYWPLALAIVTGIVIIKLDPVSIYQLVSALISDCYQLFNTVISDSLAKTFAFILVALSKVMSVVKWWKQRDTKKPSAGRSAPPCAR